MSTEDEGISVSGNLIPFDESTLERIFKVYLRNGLPLSAKLKAIRGQHLVFEQKNGETAVIHVDAVLTAFEVPRRRC